jgi:hypothetical protein
LRCSRQSLHRLSQLVHTRTQPAASPPGAAVPYFFSSST